MRDGTTATGGSGNDWFVFEPNGTPPPSGAYWEYTIEGGDPDDRLTFNGYILAGGDFTVIERYNDGSGIAEIGGFLDSHGTIYIRMEAQSAAAIILPNNETIYINDFTNGDFGITFGSVPDPHDWGSYPSSNIVDNGLIGDYENLSGRAGALASPGSSVFDPGVWADTTDWVLV